MSTIRTVFSTSVLPERGASLSVFVATALPALILIAGLAVDGAALSAASREAQITAARAARVGVNSAATERLFGLSADQVAIDAATKSLREAGIEGTVQVADGVLTVTTQSTRETTFVSLVGINQVTGRGEAAAELRRP